MAETFLEEPSFEKIYLVTDDEFGQSYVLTLASICTMVFFCVSIPFLDTAAKNAYFEMNQWMMETAHGYALWTLIGLLSSSCYALQLFLNVFSLDCSGFNTFLGPIRPISLALATSIQASSFYVAWNMPWQWKPTLVSTVIVAGLALLPEILHCYTTSNMALRGKQQKQANKNS